MNARDMLTAPSGTSVPLSKWMREHEAAREFIAEWVRLRMRGRSDWSAARVFRALRQHYKCPTKSDVSFLRWLETTYPTKYRRLISK